MIPSLLLVVPAGLTWLTAAYTGRSYLRARRDPRVAAYWHSTVLLAAALTAVVPAVYLAIDRVLGLPNAARWIGNSLILLAAYRQDGLYTVMPGASAPAWRRHRQLLVYLVLTVALMAWMLSLAHLRVSTPAFDVRSVSPPLIAYRLLYVAFFALVLARMISSCARYYRASRDATVKLAMVLDIVGAGWAIMYLVATLLDVLLPASASTAAPLNTVIQISILFAVVCLLAGSTLPLWGQRVGMPTLMRQLRMLVAYWRLRSLWRVLVAEAPTVVLPLSERWQSALFNPETLDLLLYRRVIEILDAWRQLDGLRETSEAATVSATHSPRSGAPGPAHAREVPARRGRRASGTDAHSSQENLDRYARTDAHHLLETLQYLRRHPARPAADQPLERGMVTAYRPTSYVEQLRYLERVARYVRAQRRRQAV
jgi:hypothetical protein